MDAYLSQEVRQYLKALHILSPKTNGYLIGHKRGNRFFIEKILPCPEGLALSLQKQLELSQLCEDKIIGFFSFYTDKNLLNMMLAPMSTGKLYLEINHTKKNKTTINSFIIDYDNRFYLSPIKIKPLS